MKIRLLPLALVAALSCGAANAAVITTTLIANNSANVGLITTMVTGSLTNVTGTAYLYSTPTILTTAQVAGVTTRSAFEALIAATPGQLRNVAFTNGAVTSSVQIEAGAAGNASYLWLESTDGKSYGLYSGATVPSIGALTFNSATSADLIGTSIYSATGTSGYQLAFTVIPEPSAALLGAAGVLVLLRRRRV